ncbi:MAG: ribokinase [Veillonellaceae bacterium]|nr:ribokinase [Veillonellaceae bacterium]
MNHIVVIGSCNIDISVTADKRPKAGETIIGQKLSVSPGGKGANQAVAAAKLGANVSMVGAIGQDAYGQLMKDTLKACYIDTTYLVERADTSTGTAHITLAEGDNSIIVIAGANATVDKSLIDKAWPTIEKTDLVLVQNEIPLATIGYILKQCYDHGIPVLLNPAPAMTMPQEWLAYASYITPNEHECQALFPGLSKEAIYSLTNDRLLITLGSQGVGYVRNNQLHIVPAFKVSPVDTTGAGDTFNGAFAYAIVNGQKKEDAIRFANAVAALSVQKMGAQGGMPTLDQVKQFLAERS